MVSPTEPPRHHHQLSHFVHSTTSSLLSLLSPRPPPLYLSRICAPVLLPDLPHPLSALTSCSTQHSSISSPKSTIKGLSSSSPSGFPSSVKVAGLNSEGKAAGPAFVGQVFSMCDLSGTGLMAVSTHFDVPFISKRTPEWLKKLFATITKSERNGPVFRFFMDLGDAVAYVKRLNIPSGVVGACRLDLAYEHFKENPELFQFVPNEKQVKAANKLLKINPRSDGSRKIDGVPVFSAQNLDIAIATTDGIKWYTPYFFDKNMLDKILEESVDQHFQALVQTRHTQRRREVMDDNLGADVIEEMGDSLWEPPEVQELMDEMGHPEIPLSVITKAAEIQLLYTVDRVLLGNRWLRKATGIQPKFPYLVDSFERRSAVSLRRATEPASYISKPEEFHSDSQPNADQGVNDSSCANHRKIPDLRFPFADWFSNLWLKPRSTLENQCREEGSSTGSRKQNLQPNPFLPNITMVGISTSEAGQVSKANLKKTMEDLTKELEQADERNDINTHVLKAEDRDPLFVANVGDYYSSMTKTGSSRWVRGRGG